MSGSFFLSCLCLRKVSLSAAVEECFFFCPSSSLSTEVNPTFRICRKYLKSVVLHEKVGPVPHHSLAELPGVQQLSSYCGCVWDLAFLPHHLCTPPECQPEEAMLAIQDGDGFCQHVEGTHHLWGNELLGDTMYQRDPCSSCLLWAAHHIPLHAWAPLTCASAPLHAGNKAHRKCTQPERGPLHCCHGFCPQGDHCSVQQPSGPLLLRKHPDLQQCCGVKDITWAPWAQQAVSIVHASAPWPNWGNVTQNSSLSGQGMEQTGKSGCSTQGQISWEWGTSCRDEINPLVFLCLAETDAVSTCIQHDVPACWSEQVPDSSLWALCTAGISLWLCWAGRVQLEQEEHPSWLPTGLVLTDRLWPFYFYDQTQFFPQVLKCRWNFS